MPSHYAIRAATLADVDTIVAFTVREAHEAEGAELDATAVHRGVSGAFANPPRATYWVAEASGGEVVASTSIVTEWSDFHGGNYWWVQSLFIVPEHRGSGLLELLLDHLAGAAAAVGALELRLYAHRGNERAVRAYERCRFTASDYVIMRRPL